LILAGSIGHSMVQEEVNPGKIHCRTNTFISQERLQKFNLLLHLISNISEPIVIRGPDGIGKSTILTEVKSRSLESWGVCLVEAWPGLTLERMRQMLSESVSHCVKSSLFGDLVDGLEQQLDWMEENNLLLVLLLDDVDVLAPELWQLLHQLSESYPALRLVYSMKSDGLQAMEANGADIGCYNFIDLPPLTERQCGTFIDNLSSDPQRPDVYPARTLSFVSRVYRETHGVPGEIIKVLAAKSKFKSLSEKNNINVKSVSTVVLILSVIGLLLWALLFQGQFFLRKPVLSSADGGEKKTVLSLLRSISGIMMISESDKSNALVENEEKIDNGAKTSMSQNLDNQLSRRQERPVTSGLKAPLNSEKAVIKAKTKKQRETVVPPSTGLNQFRESPIVSKKKSNNLGISGVKGADWLLNQNPENWTVQLIAVSRLDALKALIEKHPDLKLIAAIRSRANGNEFYSLYFGSFNTLEEARSAMKKLPPFFNKPWPIMFSVVHGKINSQIN